MFNSVSRKKLVQKLEKHRRTENLNSLKMKKCNPEICSEMLQSETQALKFHTLAITIYCYRNLDLVVSNKSKNQSEHFRDSKKLTLHFWSSFQLPY